MPETKNTESDFGYGRGAGTEAEGGEAGGEKVFEAVIGVAIITVIGVRDGRVGAKGRLSGGGKGDHTRRLGNGQGTHEERIPNAELRGCGADANGERTDGNERKARRLGQAPDGVAQ